MPISMFPPTPSVDALPELPEPPLLAGTTFSFLVFEYVAVYSIFSVQLTETVLSQPINA